MIKRIKCTKCGLYYNAAIYNICPHCSSTEAVMKKEDIKGEELVKEKKEIKGGTISKIFGERKGELIRKTKSHFEEVTEKEEQKATVVDILRPEKDSDDVKIDKPQKADDDDISKESAETLKKEISKVGKTVGRYVSSTSGETIEPVVGWLIGVKGTYFGQGFPLKTGNNKVGRGNEFHVKLLDDDSISKTCMAIITYDGKGRKFSIRAGESDQLSYLNGEALYDRAMLHGYEEIEFGDSEKNKFIFVPLCGEKFDWGNYENGVKRD